MTSKKLGSKLFVNAATIRGCHEVLVGRFVFRFIIELYLVVSSSGVDSEGATFLAMKMPVPTMKVNGNI